MDPIVILWIVVIVVVIAAVAALIIAMARGVWKRPDSADERTPSDDDVP
jgi:flagellar basal body-associated protein FliL